MWPISDGDDGLYIFIISVCYSDCLEFKMDPEPDESKPNLTYINFEFVNMAVIYFYKKQGHFKC